MAGYGRGCVKTKNGTRSQNFGLPECAAFDYFWLGNGRKTPEIEIALSFYTASAVSGRTSSAAPLRAQPLRQHGTSAAHRLCERVEAGVNQHEPKWGKEGDAEHSEVARRQPRRAVHGVQLVVGGPRP